jgi:uncharacterized protein (TIGR03083 family)
MELADHLAAVDHETERLARAAEMAGFDAAVPACPGWTVRDLVIHVGGVHRWAGDLVENARETFDTEAGAAVGTGPADDELLAWLRSGRDALVTTLRAAPADRTCFTLWKAPDARAFWARRQAHETAMHRADADAAAGLATDYGDAFAVDGIEEILYGFAGRKKAYEPTTLLLSAGSDSWHLTMGADGVRVRPGDSDEAADATIAGTPTDVYLWLWNRGSAATISGDAAAAERWAQLRVRWS